MKTVLVLLMFTFVSLHAQDTYKPHGVQRDSLKVARQDTIGRYWKRDSVNIAKMSQPGWFYLTAQNLSTTDTLWGQFCNAWADTAIAPVFFLSPGSSFNQAYKEVSWVRWITMKSSTSGARRILLVQ